MFDYDMTRESSGANDARELALGLRQRDVTLLHALVEQYQYRLIRYFIYLLGKREGVDDLVQETWLRVLERGSSYDGRSRFEPWLFTIARNLAFDDMRNGEPLVWSRIVMTSGMPGRHRRHQTRLRHSCLQRNRRMPLGLLTQCKCWHQSIAKHSFFAFKKTYRYKRYQPS